MIAGVYALFGSDGPQRFLPVAVLNLLIGTATVGLTIHLAGRWFGPRTGLLAGVLLAIWPAQIQFTSVLNSELPMVLAMLAALAIWEARRGPDMLRGGLAGLALGVAALMRPTALLLPGVFIVARLLRGPRRGGAVLGAVARALGLLVVVLPWSLRNYRVFGEFVLISTNGGVNFWMGNSPGTAGGYQSPDPAAAYGGEVARDRQLKAEALAHIRAPPGAFLKRTAIKALRLHERESIGVAWNERGLEQAAARISPAAVGPVIRGTKLVSNLYWWLVLALAVLGVIRLVLTRGPLAALLTAPVLIWAYFAAVHAVTVIQDRYHFAYVPCIAALAAVALTRGATTQIAPAEPVAPSPAPRAPVESGCTS